MYLNATSICSTLEIASTIINIDLTLAKLFVHKDKGIDTKKIYSTIYTLILLHSMDNLEYFTHFVD